MGNKDNLKALRHKDYAAYLEEFGKSDDAARYILSHGCCHIYALSLIEYAGRGDVAVVNIPGFVGEVPGVPFAHVLAAIDGKFYDANGSFGSADSVLASSLKEFPAYDPSFWQAGKPSIEVMPREKFERVLFMTDHALNMENFSNMMSLTSDFLLENAPVQPCSVDI